MKLLRDMCKMLLCAAILMGPVHAQTSQPLTIFAAASLKTALDDVLQAWEGPVVVSYGGSATLARQVAYGAPADLVILANTDWMGWLHKQGGLAGEPRTLLGNRLVLVAGTAGQIAPDLPDILAHLGDGRVAMGQTMAVPAGIYGRQWLQAAGLWPALSTRLAETENVRMALALVARGETPLGIVYASDAQADNRVFVAYEIPSDLHVAISYPAALTPLGAQAGAGELLTFLAGKMAQDLFGAHGFLPAAEGR